MAMRFLVLIEPASFEFSASSSTPSLPSEPFRMGAASGPRRYLVHDPPRVPIFLLIASESLSSYSRTRVWKLALGIESAPKD